MCGWVCLTPQHIPGASVTWHYSCIVLCFCSAAWTGVVLYYIVFLQPSLDWSGIVLYCVWFQFFTDFLFLCIMFSFSLNFHEKTTTNKQTNQKRVGLWLTNRFCSLLHWERYSLCRSMPPYHLYTLLFISSLHRLIRSGKPIKTVCARTQSATPPQPFHLYG